MKIFLGENPGLDSAAVNRYPHFTQSVAPGAPDELHLGQMIMANGRKRGRGLRNLKGEISVIVTAGIDLTKKQRQFSAWRDQGLTKAER
ncbi:hypothetical protein B0B52_14510 [Polaromonas sp. A23]|nr:hypothetical protein B0B52_14510 [Polaromonas sp. A23]